MPKNSPSQKKLKLTNSLKILLVVIAAIIIYFGITEVYYYSALNYSAPKPVSFTAGNKTFDFSAYAWTTPQAEKGLMNATVTNSTFMLFYLGNPGIYDFWMKDTYSYLDIMWVNASADGVGSIVYIVNATPCVYYSPNQTSCIIYMPQSEANYVIESASGFAANNKIMQGEKIKFNYN